MRKSGLTSGTLQHLTQLSSISSLNERVGNWDDEAEGVSIDEGLDNTSDDALSSGHSDDKMFDMSTESTEQVTEDSAEEYSRGVEDTAKDDKNTDPALIAEPEPWTDAWEVTANKIAYDIRNYYQEGSVDPVAGPISINVGILIETWNNLEDSDTSELAAYVQENLRENLKMSPTHHLIVEVNATTPDAGLTEDGLQVYTTFDGVEPSDVEELEILIKGLVMNAVVGHQ